MFESFDFRTWHFAEPFALAALILAVLPWLSSWRRKRLAWSTLRGFQGGSTMKARVFRFLPDLLLSLAIASLVFALARPRAIGGQTRIASKGVAITVAIDRSASMLTEDFTSETDKTPLSRLQAAKKTLSTFIEGRTDDLIGVITFAREPKRIAPLTLDHAFVQDAVRGIRAAGSGEGGTNLGHAIAFGLGDLRDAKSARKVLVLITDGRDAPAVSETSAPIVPEEAAALAKPLGITIHTIAVGGPETPVSLENMTKKPLAEPGPDLERLKSIATLGGGHAFLASDTAALRDVFQQIDSLERSSMAGTVRTRYREAYPALVIAALVFLVGERMLRAGRLRVLP